MPIYEYECLECGHKLEVIQRVTDVRLKTCPSCSQDALRKLVSAAGFQLKGTGWYETDFKHKGKAAGKKADAADGSSADSAGDKSATATADKSTGTSDTKTTTASTAAAGD